MFKKNQKPEPVPETTPKIPEKRKYERIRKNFILKYFEKNNPDKKFEVSQLKNISIGGMCFVTTQKFTPGTLMVIELKTPYLASTTFVEGKILDSHEKAKNILYDTRLEFVNIEPEAKYLLAKITDFFTKKGIE